MKMKYMVGLLFSMMITQLTFATTFKIADLIQDTNKSTQTRMVGAKTIDKIAPMYKGDKSVLSPVSQIVYVKKSKSGTQEYLVYGIKGTTLTHMLGVSFTIGNKVYKAMFEPKEVPSMLSTNVLIEIYKRPQSAVYEGRLYPNASQADNYTIIDFEALN